MATSFVVDVDNSVGDVRWWLEKDPAEVVKRVFRLIEDRDKARLTDYKEFYRLYMNQDILGFVPGEWGKLRSRQKVTLNLIRAVVDTAASRIAKENPRAVFQTYAGNFTFRKKAQLLERWVDTARYTTGADRLNVDVFVDACVFGTGCLHLFRDGNKIRAERVFPGEVFVDQVEALEGAPRNLYRRKYIDRGVLQALFPKEAKRLASLQRSQRAPNHNHSSAFASKDSLADQLEVIEAWHLPSKEGAGDGKHVISVEDITLLSEGYNKSFFPIVFMRWSRDRRGFWGCGLAHELVGLQVEINRNMGKLQKIVGLSAPAVWQEMSSVIKGQKMVNQVGAQYKYRGTPPIFSPGLTVPQELVQYIENLWNKGFQQAGINQMFTGDRPPPGVDAAVALQELADQGAMRFSLVFRDWEWFHMEMTERLVSLGREIGDSGKMVAANDRYTVEEIDFSDVDLSEDSYVLRVMPASSLPLSPALRLQRVMDMLNFGMVDVPTAKQMLDMPDIEEHMSLDRAASDNIDRILEQILDEGIYEAPEPFQDHQLALKKAQAFMNRALTMKQPPPEAHLEALRQYMKATQDLIERASMAQQVPGAAMIPGVPQGPGPTGQAPQAVTPQDGAAGPVLS